MGAFVKPRNLHFHGDSDALYAGTYQNGLGNEKKNAPGMHSWVTMCTLLPSSKSSSASRYQYHILNSISTFTLTSTIYIFTTLFTYTFTSTSTSTSSPFLYLYLYLYLFSLSLLLTSSTFLLAAYDSSQGLRKAVCTDAQSLITNR